MGPQANTRSREAARADGSAGRCQRRHDGARVVSTARAVASCGQTAALAQCTGCLLFDLGPSGLGRSTHTDTHRSVRSAVRHNRVKHSQPKRVQLQARGRVSVTAHILITSDISSERGQATTTSPCESRIKTQVKALQAYPCSSGPALEHRLCVHAGEALVGDDVVTVSQCVLKTPRMHSAKCAGGVCTHANTQYTQAP